MSIPFKPPLGSDPRDSFALAVQQAAVALIGLFVLAGAGAHFGVYHLATSQHDGYTGLDATERNVVRPVLGFLQVLALVLAVLAALVVLARRTRPATGTAVLLGGLLGGWLLIAGLLQAVPAAIYQGTVAGPNALSAQSPTITDYLKTSRAAWGLQEGPDVSVKQFGTVQTPTLSDLAADPQTVGNVRIQDYRELPETFKQIDRSRSYQTYPTITVDRYPMTGGGEAEVMLAPREIAEGDIPNRTFVNSALLYTHGYGIIAASVNQVQPDGSPHILVGGVPPNQVKNSALPSLSSAVDAKADPRIYCGMSTTQPVIVNTTQNEFDYPSGSGDATSHAGTNMAGIPVDNPVDRFALSTSAFGSLDMFLTTAMTPESRVMLHRAISDRITTLAPFLTMDSDPYIVADPVSHHLVWIADAYVTSDRFPEAFQQDDGTSYMRNAVKAVVDARTCQTTLYMVDPNEPITHAYNDIFPGLMKPLDAMPMSIRQHLRYPEDLLKAQSSAYGSVHVNPTNPGVLFTKSDLWRVADEKLNNTQTPTQAYYVEMTLPGKTKPEFVLLQTFSPAANGGNGGSANNMTAWLAAESDYTTTNHPKLVAVPLNNGSNVLGPLQFDNNINTNPDISKQLSLLGQGGSQTVLGNVIVLPFNNHSFLYVRPLYVLAANSGGSGGSFPQLVYVIAGTNANVAMGTSLSSALQQLFATTEAIPGLAASPANPSPLPGTTGPSPGITSPTPFPTSVALTGQEEQLLNDLLQHQANAEKALNKGDLVTYAQEAAAVTKDADQLSALTGSGAAASPSPSP